MLNLRPSSFLALTVFALGCGSNVVNVSPDAGPDPDVTTAADVGVPTDRSPPPDISGWCTIGSGQGLCQVGHVCPHPDGCNTCTCYAGSPFATCTTIGCTVPDAGPPLDVPGSCTLPNGATCRQGETCPAGDHCNTCVCSGATGTAQPMVVQVAYWLPP